jgi:hypothetical protein
VQLNTTATINSMITFFMLFYFYCFYCCKVNAVKNQQQSNAE